MAKTRHMVVGAMALVLATTACSAEKALIERGVAIALPKDSAVKVRWVCPPLDAGIVKDAKWYDVDFAVDAGGCPWIGRERCILMSPTKQYQYSVNQYFNDLVFLDSGALIVNSETHLGSPVPPKEKTFDYRGLPQADFQPIAEMPHPGCRIFAGAGNCLYLAGRDPVAGTNNVYHLSPEKGALRQFTRAFASKEGISAATGDGERTYIAAGRLILKVLSSGAVSKVYAHPSREITGLACDPRIGIFYATDSGVGFIGASGSVDLLAATRPQICLRQGSLYVFLPKSCGVLALDNVKDLKRFNLAVRAVPATTSAEVRVTSIRYFEAGEEAPAPENRQFALKFERAPTRYVCCQVELDNLLYEKRAHKHTLAAEFYPPGEEWAEPVTWQVDLQPDMPGVWSWARIGAGIPGTLYPGEYKVKVYLDGSKVDERKFTVTGGATALEAAWHKDTARLKALLTNGADVNEIGSDSYTPLIAAAQTASYDNVKLLLERGADVNARNSDGDTALSMAGWTEDNLQMVRLLLKHGADPNLRKSDGGTVLHQACLFSEVEVIRVLLESGADPNIRDNDGDRAIHRLGLRYSDPMLSPGVRALELLLNAGADPDASNQFGFTPLFECSQGGNIEAARLLIRHGADVKAVRKDPNGDYTTSVLGQSLLEYGWQKDPGIRDRMRAIIRLLGASGAQLLPDETYLALRDGADSLLDRKIIRDCLEKDSQLVFSYTPEDPGLRMLVLEKLMRISYSQIASADSAEGLSGALNLCLDARTKADMWGLLAKCPEISFNCGLLWTQTGNPSNARMYLEEYLRLAPDGPAASKARTLLGR